MCIYTPHKHNAVFQRVSARVSSISLSSTITTRRLHVSTQHAAQTIADITRRNMGFVEAGAQRIESLVE